MVSASFKKFLCDFRIVSARHHVIRDSLIAPPMSGICERELPALRWLNNVSNWYWLGECFWRQLSIPLSCPRAHSIADACQLEFPCRRNRLTFRAALLRMLQEPKEFGSFPPMVDCLFSVRCLMKRRHTEQPIPLNLPPMILTFSQLRPRTSSSPVFRKEVTDAMKLCPRTQHSRQFSSPQPRGCDQVPLCSAVRFIGPLDGLSSLSGVGSSPMILFLVGVVTDCVSKHRSIMGGLYSIGDCEPRQRSNCNDIQLNDGARQNQKLFQKQSMYMRLHTYMHAYIHADMHTYTHTRIQTYILF